MSDVVAICRAAAATIARRAKSPAISPCDLVGYAMIRVLELIARRPGAPEPWIVRAAFYGAQDGVGVLLGAHDARRGRERRIAHLRWLASTFRSLEETRELRHGEFVPRHQPTAPPTQEAVAEARMLLRRIGRGEAERALLVVDGARGREVGSLDGVGRFAGWRRGRRALEALRAVAERGAA